VAEEEAKRIAREWKREIEEELRRTSQPRNKGTGRLIVWTLLWLVWLGVLVMVVAWATESR
jgi:Flp pilus assembly protein TadB